MCTKINCNPKPNTFQTEVTDPSGTIHLCQWFSLNQRPDSERREVTAALGSVILTEICKPVAFIGSCYRCGGSTYKASNGCMYCSNCGANQG